MGGIMEMQIARIGQRGERGLRGRKVVVRDAFSCQSCL